MNVDDVELETLVIHSFTWRRWRASVDLRSERHRSSTARVYTSSESGASKTVDIAVAETAGLTVGLAITVGMGLFGDRVKMS